MRKEFGILAVLVIGSGFWGPRRLTLWRRRSQKLRCGTW